MPFIFELVYCVFFLYRNFVQFFSVWVYYAICFCMGILCLSILYRYTVPSFFLKFYVYFAFLNEYIVHFFFVRVYCAFVLCLSFLHQYILTLANI